MPPTDDSDNTPKFVFPGVFIEEVSSLPPSIAGVPTSITGFVGVAATRPASTAAGPFEGMSEFQETFGNAPTVSVLGKATQPNYLYLAAKAFFENGGRKLYVAQVTSADGKNTAAPTGDDFTRALNLLSGIEEIGVVAAPGAVAEGADGSVSVLPVHAALIAHASLDGAYRFAVLDAPRGASLEDIQKVRGAVDSKNAALYYPWVSITDPNAGPLRKSTINVPPSGFVCGIYARVDTTRGVWKAPANEVLTGAIGFERVVSEDDQEILNPLGINCLRSFPGKGNLVWGARTVSSDVEWKYVNVRRYMAYLEHSMDAGTAWAGFEPNQASTWVRLRGCLENFLINEWRAGELMGAKPEQAFFVQCGLGQTMTQNDIDNGRLIVLVGAAPIKPAEFVFFRVTKKIA